MGTPRSLLTYSSSSKSRSVSRSGEGGRLGIREDRCRFCAFADVLPVTWGLGFQQHAGPAVAVAAAAGDGDGDTKKDADHASPPARFRDLLGAARNAVRFITASANCPCEVSSNGNWYGRRSPCSPALRLPRCTASMTRSSEGFSATSKLQPADQENVAQTVWLNVVRLWPEPAPDNAAAYITDMTRNAVAAFYRQQRRKKCDVRRTTRLMTEAALRPDRRRPRARRRQRGEGEPRVPAPPPRAHRQEVRRGDRRDRAPPDCRGASCPRPNGAARSARCGARMGVRARKRGESHGPTSSSPQSQCGRAARDIEAEADDDDDDEAELAA